ncbi:hypothetical protein SmJEL517_g01728 [Synchytrium microbalum]|uniref:Uncharacterized protein n=1 Tax=Synchytrium microbalum TaxID=1806994 RepID=A0A507C9W2_9FUNG|nr:uncharacterized protein SmJEL517_g01728 [Synchytrium microbalum]TPX35959.1 hypothetical protein SmJEL517_g01728 [Synchytrium microbalum]
MSAPGKRPAPNGDLPDAKRPKQENGTSVAAAQAAGAPRMNPAEIAAMIAARKAEVQAKYGSQISATSAATFSATPQPATTTLTAKPQSTTPAASQPINISEIQKKIIEARAKVAAGLSSTGLAMPQDKTKRGLKAEFFPGLDLTSGAINLETIKANIPKSSFATTKANIRETSKPEKFEIKELKIERPDTAAFSDPRQNPYFDPKLTAAVAPKMRHKKTFHFVKPGAFVEEANKARAVAQLESLKQAIAESVKKSGLETEMELVSDLSIRKEPPPIVEWWDLPLLPSGSYTDVDLGRYREKLTDDSDIVTSLVHHPSKLDPPGNKAPVVARPLMLTKKEQKKLRRQKRLEAQKEKMDKIRIGLLPPDVPKLRIANLMRVLGTEAVSDPTKMEATVRAQMKARQTAAAAHDAANKLTDEQRKEKNRAKMQEDTSEIVEVAVFRLGHLENKQHKFKVDNNAQQLYLTGCVIVYQAFTLVVVEGGPKGIKKYKKLMLKRIKWEVNGMSMTRDDDNDEEEEEEDAKPNQCVLVWEGEVKTPAFEKFVFFKAPTETRVKEILAPKDVMHYWDAAKNWVPEAM